MNPSKSSGISRKSPLFIVASILAVAAVAWGYSSLDRNGMNSVDLSQTPVFEVRKGPLKINIIESGTIRPRDQKILRNELWDISTILWIVEEGEVVKKGDLLFELDATQWERDLQASKLELQNDEAQYISARENLQIVKNQADADVEQAELNLKFAEQDLNKYISGEYPKQLKEAEAAITIAKEELNQAQEELKWSKILYEEKYFSLSELQQDELTAQKAKLNLELAQEELELLKNFTHQRQLDQLKSDLRQAEMAYEREVRSASASITEASARYFWRGERFEEEKEDYRRMEEMVAKAKMYAPIDGVALYASSVMEDWEDDEDRIRVGADVDERREIIFLTAAEEYNVDILVQETDLNKIEAGLPVTITADALPEETFKGVVHYVSPLPNQRQQYLNPNLKVYNTDIQITSDVSSLRSGMSCKAEIVVDEYEDVVYVPIQAVVRVNNQPVVYVKNGGQIEMRPVAIGLDNTTMIHIKDGLDEGEVVLLKPPLDGAESQQSEPDTSTSPVSQPNELADAVDTTTAE